jgi:hypothetical protein
MPHNNHEEAAGEYIPLPADALKDPRRKSRGRRAAGLALAAVTGAGALAGGALLATHHNDAPKAEVNPAVMDLAHRYAAPDMKITNGPYGAVTIKVAMDLTDKAAYDQDHNLSPDGDYDWSDPVLVTTQVGSGGSLEPGIPGTATPQNPLPTDNPKAIMTVYRDQTTGDPVSTLEFSFGPKVKKGTTYLLGIGEGGSLTRPDGSGQAAIAVQEIGAITIVDGKAYQAFNDLDNPLPSLNNLQTNVVLGNTPAALPVFPKAA